jgi:hypothetical protein
MPKIFERGRYGDGPRNCLIRISGNAEFLCESFQIESSGEFPSPSETIDDSREAPEEARPLFSPRRRSRPPRPAVAGGDRFVIPLGAGGERSFSRGKNS